MKITLIRLSNKGMATTPAYMPLGLLYVAASLEQAGFTVEVMDLNHQTEKDMWDSIATSDVIGITMLSFVRSKGFSIINEIKNKWKDKKIVLGGMFPNSIAETIFKHYPVDYIVAGEGESAMVQICNGLINNTPQAQWFYAEPLDIDTIPYPAWHLSGFDWWNMQIAQNRPDWEVNGVKLGKARWSPIIASRGCVGRCYFCNTPQHWDFKMRFRAGGLVADEVEKLVKDHEVTLFSFDDDAFPINKKQCMDFCGEIKKRGLKIAWKSDTRADCLDREMLFAMREAGCFMLAIGIESASPTILKNINKGLDIEKARQAIKDIKDAGIKAYALLMVGNQGETDATIQETIDFLQDTKPNLFSYVTGVMVVPGTDMQKLAGIPDDYYLSGDGLPLYAEHTQEQLSYWGHQISQVPVDF